MNKVILNLFFFCSFFFLISLALLAQPTEKSLLEAWEAMQKSDPKTILFEKLAENHYRFKTKRFLFDGELKIFSIIIDEQVRGDDKKTFWGMIEVELVNQSEDFLKKHPYSYSIWMANNRFVFDKETRKWLTAKEYYSKRRKQYSRSPRIYFRDILSISFSIVLLFIFIVVINNLKKIRKKNEQNIQKSSAFYEETNRLLKEILEELKKK